MNVSCAEQAPFNVVDQGDVEKLIILKTLIVSWVGCVCVCGGGGGEVIPQYFW